METAVSSGGGGGSDAAAAAAAKVASVAVIGIADEEERLAADKATVAPVQVKTAKGQPPETSRRSPSWSSAPKISALPEMSWKCYFFWLRSKKKK